MTEPIEAQSVEATASALEQPQPSETAAEDPIWQFILEVTRKFKIERWQQSFRLTPQGLFVERSSRDEIVEFFREWFKKKTEGRANPDDERCLEKLFGSDRPERLALYEGKQTLDGYLIKCPINNAANYRLPFFLGTPTKATEQLLASDPLFRELAEIRIRPGSSDVELTLKQETITIPQPALLRFRALAEGSFKVKREFPQFEESLAETLRAMVNLLKRARRVPIEKELMRPRRFLRQGNRIDVREVSGFYFLIERGIVIFSFHFHDRNLYELIRDEINISLAQETRGVIGSFEIFKRNHQLVGSFEVHGRRVALHGHALQSFIEELVDDQPARLAERPPLTIREYLREFVSTVQLAQKIGRDKIMNYLKPSHQKGHWFLTNERWLFVISSKDIIVEAIVKDRRHRRG